MKTNEELINEAVERAITTDDGGQLSPEQQDYFIGLGVDQSALLSRMSVVTGISASEFQMHTLGFGSRILRKGVEGTEFETITDPSIVKRVLTPKEAVLAFDITRQFMMRNIQKGNADEVISKQAAIQFMNDAVDVGINGDTASGTAFLTIIDGFLKKMKAEGALTHLGSFGNNDANKIIFNEMLRELPDKWRRNTNDLAYIVSPSRFQDYQDELGDRVTVLGDTALTKSMPLFYKGIEVIPEPTLPNSEIILTNPKNLFMGVGEDMTLEKEYHKRKRAWEFTMTSYFDFNFAIGDLVVLYTQG